MSPNKILGLFSITIAGVILYVILDAISQSLPPFYSPISQAESLLAVGPYGYIMAINFLNRGLFSLAFIFGFIMTLDVVGVSRNRFRSGISLLGIWAVGAILLAFFTATQNWQGEVHLVIAFIAFLAGAFGTLELSRKLNSSHEGLQKLRRIAFPLSVVVVICWAVEFSLIFVAPHLNSRIGGLTERLFLGSILLWIIVTSIYMITHRHSMLLDSQQTIATVG